MILIQNGRVLDPVTNTDQVMDVLLDESGIVKTGEHLEAEGADVIDASGLVVAPGLMDAHVHFRDPGLTYKEDIFTGAAAAARGGFTTVVCMANTKPCAAGSGHLQGSEGRRTYGYGSAGSGRSRRVYR